MSKTIRFVSYPTLHLHLLVAILTIISTVMSDEVSQICTEDTTFLYQSYPDTNTFDTSQYNDENICDEVGGAEDSVLCIYDYSTQAAEIEEECIDGTDALGQFFKFQLSYLCDDNTDLTYLIDASNVPSCVSFSCSESEAKAGAELAFLGSLSENGFTCEEIAGIPSASPTAFSASDTRERVAAVKFSLSIGVSMMLLALL